MQRITLVVAHARNRVIGHKGRMPWHLPADLAHFKAVTMGKTMVMGRKTFESIGRALPGRRSIVITRDSAFTALATDVAFSFEEALSLAGDGEVMVIGGGQVYAMALPLAHRIQLTEIEAEIGGDTYFPELGPEWREVSREVWEADEANAYRLVFRTLER